MITISLLFHLPSSAWFPYGSPAAPRCPGGDQKASAIFNTPPSRLAPRQPAPDTGCRARWGTRCWSKKAEGSRKIKSEPPGAGDREGDKVSIETDIQGNGLGAKWGQGKGGKIWKYCFALRFLPLQAPLLCNVFSYKLPRFSHLRELFLQQPSPASSWVSFPCQNSLKLLLPPNSSLLPSLYSEAASRGRKFPPVPECFQWLKTSYVELWRERGKKSPAKLQLC